jgi:hypothetical protein
MAEVAAGLYAVETALEGAALGAFAVSRPTAPLHLSFRRISSPAEGQKLARSGHTLNIVKGKAYLVGGQSDGEVISGSSDSGEDRILTLTLPVASSTDGEGHLAPLDYEVLRPEFKSADRPLAPRGQSEAEGNTLSQPYDRVGHTTTTLNDRLYIWGGQSKSSNASGHDLADQFVVFDPLTNSYDVQEPDISRSPQGVPPPRLNHAATASPDSHPQVPVSHPTLGAHGTIFIHGGTSTEDPKVTFRDTWAFDVATSVWSRLDTIPEPGPSEVPNEGRLAYMDGKLWRLGDGFGRVMYLDLIRSQSSSVAPDAKWQVITFGTEATDPEAKNTDANVSHASSDTLALPMPRTSATLLPVTTGSGRQYLLYFMGQEPATGVLNDFWSFQIPSEEKTAANVKDTVRDAVASRVKESWSSGKLSWAKCEVDLRSSNLPDSKAQGRGDEKEKSSTAIWPEGEGLSGFGSDVWADQGGHVFVIWGGTRAGRDGAVDEGWVVTVK